MYFSLSSVKKIKKFLSVLLCVILIFSGVDYRTLYFHADELSSQRYWIAGKASIFGEDWVEVEMSKEDDGTYSYELGYLNVNSFEACLYYDEAWGMVKYFENIPVSAAGYIKVYATIDENDYMKSILVAKVYEDDTYTTEMTVVDKDYYIAVGELQSSLTKMYKENDGTYSFKLGQITEGVSEWIAVSEDAEWNGTISFGTRSIPEGYVKLIFYPIQSKLDVKVYQDVNYINEIGINENFYVGFVDDLTGANEMSKEGDGTYIYDCGYLEEGSTEFAIYSTVDWNSAVTSWRAYIIYSDGFGRIVYNPSDNSVDFQVYKDANYSEYIVNTKEKPDYYFGYNGNLKPMCKEDNGVYTYEYGYVEGAKNLGYGIYGGTGSWNDNIIGWTYYYIEYDGYLKVYYDSVLKVVSFKIFAEKTYTHTYEQRYIGINNKLIEMNYDGKGQYSYECGFLDKGTILFGIYDYWQLWGEVLISDRNYEIKTGGYIKVFYNDYDNIAYIKEFFDEDYSKESEFLYIIGSDYYDYFDNGIFSNCWGHNASEWNVEFQTFDGEPVYKDMISRINMEDYVVWYSTNKAEIGKRYKFSIIDGMTGNVIGEDYSFVAISDGYVSIKYYYETGKYTVTYFDYDTEANIALLNMELSVNEFTYDGQEKQPKVSIEGLVEGEDYQVNYMDDCINVGKKYVYVKGINNYTGEASLEYQINSKDISECDVKLYSDEFEYREGENYYATPIVKDGNTYLQNEEDYVVRYPNDTHNAGEKELIVEGKGNYKGSVSVNYNIQRKNIEDMSIVLSNVEFIYTGEEIEPNVIVKYKDDDSLKTTRDVDFEVKYEKNINVGTASVVVTGIGNYMGEVTLNYQIIAKEISSCIVKCTPNEFIYNGLPTETDVLVADGEKILVENEDYKIDYPEDIVSVGEKVIIVTGIGNYTGKKSTKVVVDSKNINECTIFIEPTKAIYNGEDIIPSVVIKNGDNILELENDYELSLVDDIKNVGEKTITITGIGNYSGSVLKTYSIDPMSIIGMKVVLSQTEYTYSGNENIPDISVGYDEGDKHIVLGEDDYKVDFEDNINAGEALVIITGLGNYTGTIETTFMINSKNIEICEAKIISKDKEYDGKKLMPDIEVKDGEEYLKENKDYTIVYPSDLVNVGEKKIKIVGIGNYSGEIELKYNILEKKKDNPEEKVVDKKKDSKELPCEGDTLSDNNCAYTVVKAGSIDGSVIGEIIITKNNNRKIKKLVIKDYITINGIKYKVVGIGKKAYANCKKLKKVIIGKNVRSIGTKAFYNCKKLRIVSIKSLLIKKIGKKAFYKRSGKQLLIIVPKLQKKIYKKLIKNAKTNKYRIK